MDTVYGLWFDLRTIGPSVIRHLVKFSWAEILEVSDSVDGWGVTVSPTWEHSFSNED